MFQAYLIEKHFSNLSYSFAEALEKDKTNLNVVIEEQVFNENYEPYIDSINIRYKLYLVSGSDDNNAYQSIERYQLRIFLYLPLDQLNYNEIIFIKDAYIEYLKMGLNLDNGRCLLLDKNTVSTYKQNFINLLSLTNFSDLALNNTVIPKVLIANVDKLTETDSVVSFDISLDLEALITKYNRGE